MQYSTNYNLNLVEGTDIVNPLVIDKPNYQTIDAAMKANKDAAVDGASHTKAGTVHAIVRSNTDANVFRFVASAPYTSGDTFTVDGVAVTGINTAGEGLATNDFVIGASVLCVLNSGTLTLNVNKKVTIPATYDAADIVYDNTGTNLLSTNAQNAITETADAVILQTPGTNISLAFTSLPVSFDSVQGECFVPFPFYTKNLNYDVTITICEQTNVGALTPFNIAKAHNGFRFFIPTTVEYPISQGAVTITFH